MKVLLYVNSVVRAGVEEHVLTLANGLCGDFEMVLACPAELLRQMDGDMAGGVGRRSIESAGSVPTDVMRFMKLVRAERPAIVHSHLFHSSIIASPAAKLCGKTKTLETSHGPEVWRRGWLKRSYLADRLCRNFVDRFIAVSWAARDHLISKKGISARRITVVWNGRDLSMYDAAFRGKQDGAGASSGSDLLRIGVVGRLDSQKGHRHLVEAVPHVLREFPNTRFIFAGDGPLRPFLEEQATELGVRGSIDFMGYCSDVPSFLGNLDMLVLPSLYEGLPLVVIEASASGLPVVASGVDGTREIIRDGEAGLLVPPGDAPALARAIVTLCGDPERRKAMGLSGRRRVEQHFSLEKQLEETRKVYLELIEGRYS